MGKLFLSKSEILENVKYKDYFDKTIKEKINELKANRNFYGGCPGNLFIGREILKDDFEVVHLDNCELQGEKQGVPEEYKSSCEICWYNIIGNFIIDKKNNMEEW